MELLKKSENHKEFLQFIVIKLNIYQDFIDKIECNDKISLKKN